MSRPFRRYCYFLAEKLGKDIDEVLSWSSAKISGWMAFDLTNDSKWLEHYENEKEMAKQRASNQYRANLLKQLLGGTEDGNNS